MKDAAMNKRFLIVGQGLAGSSLAWKLIAKGQRCLVVDRALGETASRVAAGLVNPLLGRKLKPDWRQEQCLAAAHAYYRETEQVLGGSWWQLGEIWRELKDEDQEYFWTQRQQEEESASFAGPLLPWLPEWKGLGKAAITYDAAVLHAEALVNAQRKWLQERDSFVEANLSPSELEYSSEGGILWRGEHFQAVIWCTGFEIAESLELPYLQSRLSQGCILDLKLPDFDLYKDFHGVLHFGHWLVKHGEIWRLGASYDWIWSAAGTASPTAPDGLLYELRQRYQGDVEVLRARAAVRPIIRYSQPVAGALPERPGHYLMAGLGSRGCTTSPWVSEQLANHLCDAAKYPLPKDLIPDALYERYCRKNELQRKR